MVIISTSGLLFLRTAVTGISLWMTVLVLLLMLRGLSIVGENKGRVINLRIVVSVVHWLSDRVLKAMDKIKKVIVRTLIKRLWGRSIICGDNGDQHYIDRLVIAARVVVCGTARTARTSPSDSLLRVFGVSRVMMDEASRSPLVIDFAVRIKGALILICSKENFLAALRVSWGRASDCKVVFCRHHHCIKELHDYGDVT